MGLYKALDWWSIIEMVDEIMEGQGNKCFRNSEYAGYYDELLTELANAAGDLYCDIMELGFFGKPEEREITMTILYRDEDTGTEAGINDDGDLFLGDNKSGYNLHDTPENRRYIERDFVRYTGKSLEYGASWRKRVV